MTCHGLCTAVFLYAELKAFLHMIGCHEIKVGIKKWWNVTQSALQPIRWFSDSRDFKRTKSTNTANRMFWNTSWHNFIGSEIVMFMEPYPDDIFLECMSSFGSPENTDVNGFCSRVEGFFRRNHLFWPYFISRNWTYGLLSIIYQFPRRNIRGFIIWKENANIFYVGRFSALPHKAGQICLKL